MEEALVAILLANSGVTGLTGTRMHWLQRPQGGQTPVLTLTRISGGQNYTYSGRDGLVESRVQIDAWAERYGDAKALARAVGNALGGYRMTTGVIRSAFLYSERDGLEAIDPGGSLVRVLLDFTVWHQEP
jgi:hypothetical protein